MKEAKSIPQSHKYIISHLPWLGTGASLQSCGVKVLLWAQTKVLPQKRKNAFKNIKYKNNTGIINKKKQYPFYIEISNGMV